MQEIKVINLGFVNVFLIKTSQGFILIDSAIPQEWKKLESALLKAGALPDKLCLVIITHGDPDHTGNCRQLKEKYKVKIAMHKADYDMVESGIYLKRKTRPLSFRILFGIASLLQKTQKKMAEKIRFKPDFFLKDGQSMKKYGFDAKIMHIPGHTKGSIAVLTKERDLFIGDTLVNMRKPDTAIIIESEDDLKASLEKIKKLKIRTVYPGHGRPFLMSDLKM
jgi:hydroxyacylglutathione hydrolase